MISALADVDVVGRVRDGLVLQRDVDASGASMLRSVVNTVGAVAVVGDLGGHVALGAGDLHLERVATLAHGLTVGANGLDGEVSGQVVLHAFGLDTGAVHLGLRRISADVDANAGLGGKVNGDVVLAVVSSLVGNSPGAVVVVLEEANQTSN